MNTILSFAPDGRGLRNIKHTNTKSGQPSGLFDQTSRQTSRRHTRIHKLVTAEGRTELKPIERHDQRHIAAETSQPTRAIGSTVRSHNQYRQIATAQSGTYHIKARHHLPGTPSQTEKVKTTRHQERCHLVGKTRVDPYSTTCRPGEDIAGDGSVYHITIRAQP